MKILNDNLLEKLSTQRLNALLKVVEKNLKCLMFGKYSWEYRDWDDYKVIDPIEIKEIKEYRHKIRKILATRS